MSPNAVIANQAGRLLQRGALIYYLAEWIITPMYRCHSVNSCRIALK